MADNTPSIKSLNPPRIKSLLDPDTLTEMEDLRDQYLADRVRILASALLHRGYELQIDLDPETDALEWLRFSRTHTEEL